MRQTTVGLVLLVATVLVLGTTLEGQESTFAPIVTNHRTFKASLERIARGSALFRTDLEVIGRTGRQVVVLTPDAVAVLDPAKPGKLRPFDGTVLAEVAVVSSDDGAVDAVLVIVNLALLAESHARRGASNAERNADLDRILVHEVYGHALPYLVAGDRSGQCPDPAVGQPAVDACSIRRENAVRAELGLGDRRDYGLASLALARAYR